MSEIPRILHQMAPRNRENWHPIWHRCQESWFRHFGSFEYQMWDDERIEEFVMSTFPQEYAAFIACPLQNIRFDWARYMILHRYGGIYADMDMYCYVNFVDELDREVHLAEVQNVQNDELVQNSLMAGIPEHPFFRACMMETRRRAQAADPDALKRPESYAPDIPINNFLSRYVAGPILLSDVYRNYPFKGGVALLPKETYNAHHLTYRPDYRAKHMVTGRWGEVVVEALRKRKAAMNPAMSDKEFEKLDYLEFRSVSADSFDFYRNYLE